MADKVGVAATTDSALTPPVPRPLRRSLRWPLHSAHRSRGCGHTLGPAPIRCRDVWQIGILVPESVHSIQYGVNRGTLWVSNVKLYGNRVRGAPGGHRRNEIRLKPKHNRVSGLRQQCGSQTMPRTAAEPLAVLPIARISRTLHLTSVLYKGRECPHIYVQRRWQLRLRRSWRRPSCASNATRA